MEMVDYYRINVSRNGRYLFATEQGGITYEHVKIVAIEFAESYLAKI